MPCSDSSSSMVFYLDEHDKFIKFEYAKITCGQEIKGGPGLTDVFKGLSPDEILQMPFEQVTKSLNADTEESQFILYLEWDALRAALAKYVGTDDPHIDAERCVISSIENTEEGVEVVLVILPPKEMPKILPCSLNKQ